MERDWEDTLRSWVRPPSDNEDRKRNKTEEEIKKALGTSLRLKSVGYKVYAKGSYANNTNVRLDYDVDVAVECSDFYYHELIGTANDVKRAAVEKKLIAYNGGYTISQFKNDVEQALVDCYGRDAVKRGNMAMRVRKNKTTLPADVVPCFDFRHIYDVDWFGNIQFHKGTLIYPDKGSYVLNWPKQQYDMGVAKNNATKRRYKRMVRALKRLENELVKAGQIDELPSFFMECLVYNVPNSNFNHSKYVTDMRTVVATIFNETLSEEKCSNWLEVNERKYLFHSSQPWTYKQAHDLADKAWNYMGFE